MRTVLRKGFAGVEFLVVVGLIAAIGFVVFNLSDGHRESVLSASTVTMNSNQVFNEDGDQYNYPPGNPWIGTGENGDDSWLGMIFSGGSIPKNSHITNAKVEFSTPEDYWLTIGTQFYGETNNDPANFSDSSPTSSRSLTGANHEYSDNVKWAKGESYSYDVTNIIQELVNSSARSKIAIIVKGKGGSWGRKFINNNPKLIITYEDEGETQTSEPTSTATATATSTPTATATEAATANPTSTSTARPTNSATSRPTSNPTIGGDPGTPNNEIYGAVPDDVLGTCTHAIHDRYVVRGPDGRLYRTWHPTTVAVDPNDPSKGTCTFAHEHGDNPATSNIYNGEPVPFSYIGSHIGIDMPHVGYKCFVHNAGDTNDEGGAALHNSYYCFHMGTAGVGRYTARFHELYLHVLTANGYKMDLQGLANTGGLAGSICDNPRAGRTVQSLGCKIDSSYEIWANDLVINNRGNTVAFAEVSTAVFDPITTMDPSDRTRVLYTWDPEVDQIYKFNNPRDNYRGCNREAYTGPLSWSNQGGSEVYYTDVYGNVEDGGPLKQEVSKIETNANTGYIDQYGALIMAYKGGTEPQSQFKMKQNACVPGLGIQN